MDNKSKILFSLLLVMFVFLAFLKYGHYIEERDYVIYDNIECNPQIESCFISDCSPEVDQDCDLTPYKKIERLASDIENCAAGKCEDLGCIDPNGCMITLCASENLEEGEICIFSPADSDANTVIEVNEN